MLKALAMDICSLCSHAAEAPLALAEATFCPSCAALLGRTLLARPERLAHVWPLLVEEEDDDPEPRIRLADGTSIEVRERSAQLKAELSPDERMQLAEMLATLGLAREHLLECGFVLSTEPSPALAQRALALLFSTTAPTAAIAPLRATLFPS
jgi:hypothetical protein